MAAFQEKTEIARGGSEILPLGEETKGGVKGGRGLSLKWKGTFCSLSAQIALLLGSSGLAPEKSSAVLQGKKIKK